MSSWPLRALLRGIALLLIRVALMRASRLGSARGEERLAVAGAGRPSRCGALRRLAGNRGCRASQVCRAGELEYLYVTADPEARYDLDFPAASMSPCRRSRCSAQRMLAPRYGEPRRRSENLARRHRLIAPIALGEPEPASASKAIWPSAGKIAAVRAGQFRILLGYACTDGPARSPPAQIGASSTASAHAGVVRIISA